MNKFTFTKLSIPDVILIEPKRFEDTRGFFSETYNKQEFVEAGILEDFVQDNHSFSVKGVIRGLHISKSPKETAKLIRCIQGEIMDVAVDVRPGSATYGKWVSEILNTETGKMLFVPKGFAHGFCVLSNTASITYKVTDYYYPECDKGVRWNDPDIGIKWSIDSPILSEKDKSLPFLKDLFK
jgi:dTDP-4-dehydrorhamnose 3,5-epimerase